VANLYNARHGASVPPYNETHAFMD
jgi:hypothetical protein